MANVMKMTMIQAIQSLRSAGLSYREIARRLGIDRGTVTRYARMAAEPVSKPAKVLVSPAGPAEAVAGFEVLTGFHGSSRSGIEDSPRSGFIRICGLSFRVLQRSDTTVSGGC